MGCVGKWQVWRDQDASYFAKIDAERIALSGVMCEYYSLNRGGNVDAVYGEPDNDPLYGGENPLSPLGTPQTHDLSWEFCPNIAQGDEPFAFPCNFQFTEADDRNPMVRPEGKVVEYDAILILSKFTWECQIEDLGLECLDGRYPKEGDVLYCFDEWWDVVKAGKSGNVLGTATVMGYKLELKKRTQFTPDRKVDL